jgi:hypothetical protein
MGFLSYYWQIVRGPWWLAVIEVIGIAVPGALAISHSDDPWMWVALGLLTVVVVQLVGFALSYREQKKRDTSLPTLLEKHITDSLKIVTELSEPAQPTETTPGLFSMDLFPDEAKWDRAFEVDQRARELLITHNHASLLGDYAEAANDSLKRDREKKEAQQEKDNERLSEAESFRKFVERMHQSPAEFARAFVAGAAAARKRLGY